MCDRKQTSDDSHHRLIKDVHISNVLRKDKGDRAELKSWKINDFTKKGDNFASIVTSVEISYSLHGAIGSDSYIVKISKESNYENFNLFMKTAFQKEKEFYEQIAPAMNSELKCVGQDALKIPKWFLSAKVEQNDLMFFEDLRVRNFKMADRTEGMDVSHSVMVLKEIARLHAASVLLQERHSEENLSKIFPLLDLNWHNYSDKAEKFFKDFFGSHYENAIEILLSIQGYEVAQKWMIEYKKKVSENFKRLIIREAPFSVICHGDTWNNNILFRYDDAGIPVDVILLDLQLCRQASLATDLSYFLYTSIVGDVRKDNLSQFLETYYCSYQHVLKSSSKCNSFSQEELFQEYKDKSEFGLMFSLLNISVVLRPPEKMPDMDSIYTEEDFQNFLVDWRNGSLETLHTNPLLKPRFLSLFDDMIEWGIIS